MEAINNTTNQRATVRASARLIVRASDRITARIERIGPMTTRVALMLGDRLVSIMMGTVRTVDMATAPGRAILEVVGSDGLTSCIVMVDDIVEVDA